MKLLVNRVFISNFVLDNLKTMKLFYILMLIPFWSCSAQQKLKIETILVEPSRVTKENPETGKVFQHTTFVPVAASLEPMISVQKKENNMLTFLLQGNIRSAGHSINRVKRIRFESAEQEGDKLTLKYYVEIKHIPGKEGGNVRGYNYTKVENYTLPKAVKQVYIELYEHRINLHSASKQPKLKLVAKELLEL